MEVIITYLTIRVIRSKILDKLSVDRRVGDGRYAIPDEQALCARSFIDLACILFHSRQCRYLPPRSPARVAFVQSCFLYRCTLLALFLPTPVPRPFSLLRSSPFIYSRYRVTLLSTRTSHPRPSQYPSENTHSLERRERENTCRPRDAKRDPNGIYILFYP